MECRHILSVATCWVYQAHAVRVNPFTVPAGKEVVEVIIGGRVIFDDGSGEKIYGTGSIFWHRAGEQTVCRSVPGELYRCLSLHFMVDDTPCRCRRTGRWHSPMAPELFAADAVNCFEYWPRESRELLTLYIAGTLLRQMNCDAVPPLPQALHNACIIIEQNPAAELNVSELARSCGVSKPHLFNLFRRYIHCSPYRYMLDQRLKQARCLLIDPDIPIKSIGEACGFRSIELFYRHFRNAEGMTPLEYRRRHGGER